MQDEEKTEFDKVLNEFKQTEQLYNESLSNLAKINIESLRIAYKSLSKKDSKKMTPCEDVEKLIQAAITLYEKHSNFNQNFQSSEFNADVWDKQYEDYAAAFIEFQKTHTEISSGKLSIIKVPPVFDAQFKTALNPPHNKIDFDAHIIKPSQRFARYPLLLGEMKKKCDAGSNKIAEIDAVTPKVENVLIKMQESILRPTESVQAPSKTKAKSKRNPWNALKKASGKLRTSSTKDTFSISKPSGPPIDLIRPVEQKQPQKNDASSGPSVAPPPEPVVDALPTTSGSFDARQADIKLPDDAREVIEAFNENNLLARAHHAGLDFEASKQPSAAINVGNFKHELRQMQSMTDDEGNDIRGGNRCVSTTLLVPGVPIKLFGSVGFLHDADECTARGYMYENSVTLGVRNQAFRNVNHEKHKFEPFIDRGQFAKAYRVKFKEFQAMRQEYYDEVKQSIIKNNEVVDERQIMDIVESKFGGKEYNEVLANVYPQSLKGIVLNQEDPMSQMKAISLQAQLEAEGTSLRIYHLKDGQLNLFQPSPEHVANVLNDCQDVIKQQAYDDMTRLLNIKRMAPEFFSKQDKSELKQHARLFNILNNSNPKQKNELLSTLAGQMGYKLNVDKSTTSIEASMLTHVGFTPRQQQEESLGRSDKLRGKGEKAAHKITDAFQRVRIKEKEVLHKIIKQASKSNQAQENMEVSAPHSGRAAGQQAESQTTLEKMNQQVEADVQSLMQDCLMILNLLDSNQKSKGDKIFSTASRDSLRAGKAEILKEVMFYSKQLHESAKAGTLSSESMNNYLVEINRLKDTSAKYDSIAKQETSKGPVKDVLNKATRMITHAHAILKDKVQSKISGKK